MYLIIVSKILSICNASGMFINPKNAKESNIKIEKIRGFNYKHEKQNL